MVACKRIGILLLFWLACLQCYLYNLNNSASLTLSRISLQKEKYPSPTALLVKPVLYQVVFSQLAGTKWSNQPVSKFY